MKYIYTTLIVLLIFTFGLVSAQQIESSSAQEKIVEPMERYIITFTEAPGQSGRQLVRSWGGDIRYGYSTVPAVAAKLPAAALEGIARHPRVERIEPDGIVTALAGRELENAWGVKHIGAGEVHAEYSNTGTAVKIGIIDSGINHWHPELKGNYLGGYDFYYYNDDGMDVYGHGTHVAGTACATYNDNAEQLDNGEPLFGVVGTAPNCGLYSLRVLNEDGVGYWSDIMAAVEWSTGAENIWLEPWGEIDGTSVDGERMDVINLSLGKSQDPGQTVAEVFANAYEEGVLIVAAAGNSGNRGGGGDNVIYPAKFDSVIAVGATDQNDNRATFSSTGEDLELSAPGVDVYSTWNNDTAYYGRANCRDELQVYKLPENEEADSVLVGDCFKYGSGTSMASPHVAGVAALIMAAGLEDNKEVRAHMRETATLLGEARQYGYGLVNAVSAVEALEPVATGGLAGTVTEAETADGLSEATVEIADLGLSTGTDSDGSYSFDEVSVGDWTVTASADGYDSATKTVIIKEGDIIDQDFDLDIIPTYSVSGMVMEEEAGTGLEGATVTVEGANQEVVTDEYGEYEIPAVEAGTYDITAVKDGYQAVTLEAVKVNEDITEFNFTLEETADTKPEIVRFELEDTGNPAWNRVAVDWAVFSETGDLAEVILELLENYEDESSEALDTKTIDVSGSEAEGVDELRSRDNGYNVRMTVVDTGQKSVTETKEIK